MEHLDRRGMSAGEIYILNIVILIISILSVSGAGWIILSFTVCPLGSILYCPTLFTVLDVQVSENFQAPINPVSKFTAFDFSLLPINTAASLPAISLWR
jgi:hypothetical protein